MHVYNLRQFSSLNSMCFDSISDFDGKVDWIAYQYYEQQATVGNQRQTNCVNIEPTFCNTHSMWSK